MFSRISYNFLGSKRKSVVYTECSKQEFISPYMNHEYIQQYKQGKTIWTSDHRTLCKKGEEQKLAFKEK